jgi:phosphatidylethanolamine/phosphatidyl-N-methylethanolamine N-methyltransferase
MSQIKRLAKEAKDILQEDEARFFKNWIKNPLQLGAIMPSSSFLAKKMAEQVDLKLEGDILELGPGTGPITEQLLAIGIDEARLILIEYDASFVVLLRQRFPKARVIQGDAYHLHATLPDMPLGSLAAIVSSLPLQTKQEKERLELLREGFSFLQPSAPFIQFTYAPLSPLPASKKYSTKGSDPVWRNMPPARVFTYKELLKVEINER